MGITSNVIHKKVDVHFYTSTVILSNYFFP